MQKESHSSRFRKQKGAVLVEYGLLIAAVGLMSAAAISVFGHKTTDLIASVGAILPGAHADDNGPIVSGKLIETTSAEDGDITLNITDIVANAGTARLGTNMGLDLSELVVEAGEDDGGGTPPTP